MPSFSIIHVGVYRGAKKGKKPEVINTPLVSLLVHGFAFRSTLWPDGSQMMWTDPSPRFCIEVPGFTIDFTPAAGRENWVVQLQTDDLRFDIKRGEIMLRDAGEWFPVPYFAEVAPDRLPYWRSQFERMRIAWAGTTPRDRLWAQLGVTEILRYIIQQHEPPHHDTPAAMLKRLIDEDTHHVHTLTQLCAACGRSPTHLRRQFLQEYHVHPKAYRDQCRIARVMDLVAHSGMTVKEIARATRFRHVSHLSAAFRKAQGITLTEAIRRYRR